MDPSSSTDEPADAVDPAIPAGSSPSAAPPSLVRDLLRVLACAVLTSLAVAAPAGALLFAPFVPALVAVRLLRHRASARRFLVMATVASLVLALAGASGAVLVAAAVAVLLLVPVLGLEHARAARHDPVEAEPRDDWPEPRLGTGFSRAVLAWSAATAVAAASFAPLVESPRDLGRDVARDGYSFYTTECAEGGSLADREDFCRRILDQRDAVLDVVDDGAAELLAAIAAAFAFGGAATAHMVTLRRGRPWSPRVRPAWRMRDMEVHWAAAYLVAGGLLAWMAADGDDAWLTAVRAAGVAAATLGSLLVASQGLGLVAWLLTRRRTPGWYRAFLVVGALFVLPAALVTVFALGVVDLAVRPRRRAAASGNVPRRGSGS